MRRYSLTRHTGGPAPDRHFVNGRSCTAAHYDLIRNNPRARLDTMHNRCNGERVTYYTSVTITE